MNMDNRDHAMRGWFIGFAMGFVLAAILFSFEIVELNNRAIAHGVAQYNPTTGKLEWKDEEP